MDRAVGDAWRKTAPDPFSWFCSMHDAYRHPVETIVRLAGLESPTGRDLLQLGYNLGRLSEMTGLGRSPFWDRWKDAVGSWDRAQLPVLATALSQEAHGWPGPLG